MTQDMRVQRTLHAIHTAFWAALAHRGFEHLAVADLIRHAEIGKATFYHHYVDKYDLARQLMDASLKPIMTTATTRLRQRDLNALFAPLPKALTDDAAHLRLLATIETPELDFRQRATQQLAGVLLAAMHQRGLLLPHEKSVAQSLATQGYQILMTYLLGDGSVSEQTRQAQLHELRLAWATLF